MSTPVSVIPDDEHLERYLEYRRPAQPLMQEAFVEAMERGLMEHLAHGPKTRCVFRRTDVLGPKQPGGGRRD